MNLEAEGHSDDFKAFFKNHIEIVLGMHANTARLDASTLHGVIVDWSILDH